MWFVFALLSAIFAALTSILAKIGIEDVNSNLATALRTFVVLAMSWVMVFITNAQGGIADITSAAGCSLFCPVLPPVHPGCAIIGHCSWDKLPGSYPLIS